MEYTKLQLENFERLIKFEDSIREALFDLALRFNTTEMFEGTRFHDATIRAMHKLGILPKDYDLKVIDDVK